MLVMAWQAVAPGRDPAAGLRAARDEIERVDRHKVVNFDLTFDPVEPGPFGSDLDHPIPF